MTSPVPTTSPATATSVWTIDPAHTLVEFSARHMMVSTVKGRFTDVQGKITDIGDDPSRSSVDIQIAAISINTADPRRDGHLASADFLDAEHFPTITFKSRRVDGSGAEFKLIGDLTIRDQTREVSLDVTFNGIGTSPYGQTVAGFSAATKLNRKDFGLNWNVGLEAGGVLVGDQLKIEIELEAIKETA
jgi:polyisoprenoid-binding protein YceI